MMTGNTIDDESHEAAANVSVTTKRETNFLDGVIRVLLNARRVLSASYCIGYFIPPESNDLIQGHETLQVSIIIIKTCTYILLQ